MLEVTITCSPEQAADVEQISTLVTIKSGRHFPFIRIKKRSLDARSKYLKVNLILECDHVALPSRVRTFAFEEVSPSSPIVHIIGSGPAGLFAALQALELGWKPILYERGKDIRSRRRDLAKIAREQRIDENSNYCFGEGGAGTYSDGKLYTRSKKRGEVDKVLELLVSFGAKEDILVDAHPHIGTNKLPDIISEIRSLILNKGGLVYFESRLTDVKIEKQKITSIEINSKDWIAVDHLILATGHSARDVFYLLNKRGVKLLPKPFALGVRVEHTQHLIDKLQYSGRLNDEFVPPASYALVEQVNGRGVYSFCMCPGGIIAPCATANGEVVTNGWSPSKRNNPYANSGIVVAVSPDDFDHSNNPFVCLDFQKEVETACFKATGDNQKVPAQRLKDFVEGKKSIDFPKTSYQPGIESVRLDQLLPDLISGTLKKAFVAFENKMPGFLTNEAVIHAPESRTSSPVLIPRDKDRLHHVEINNLYPCAEGAGYAGGIVSAAIDGMKCMEKISQL